jgi:hypothetical protein
VRGAGRGRGLAALTRTGNDTLDVTAAAGAAYLGRVLRRPVPRPGPSRPPVARAAAVGARWVRAQAGWPVLLAGAVACTPAPPPGPRVVQVAAPTGEAARDRTALLAAIAALRPGDTLQFRAGTYRVGGGLEVAVPAVLLRGAAEGTELEGCAPAAVVAMGEEAFSGACAGLVLTGARQTLRGLTFTRFSTALVLAGGRDSAGPLPNTGGGQRVEGNTFRASSRVEVWHDAAEPAVIRNNRFVDLHQPLYVLGRRVEIRDNRIESAAPARVPYAWPAAAVTVRPLRDGACGDAVVAGNRIRGHVDGVVVVVAPGDAPGSTCARIAVRGNAVTLPALRYPAQVRALAGEPLRGVAIRLANLQRALAEGALPVPAPAAGWPAAFATAAIRDVVLEGNQVRGAVGVAVELLHAAAVTLAGNDIAPVTPLSAEERDRLVRTGTLGAGGGVWLLAPDWQAANGRRVWEWPAAPVRGGPP